MNSLKELTDLELMKLYQQAQELRLGYMIDRIKSEFSRREREQ